MGASGQISSGGALPGAGLGIAEGWFCGVCGEGTMSWERWSCEGCGAVRTFG